MSKDYNTLRHVVRLPHSYAAGPVWTRFYEGLKEEKIYGTRCDKCSRIYVPARSFCPNCLENLDEWVEVSQEGEVVSWAYSSNREFFGMQVKPPFIIALIRLDNTDSNLLHFVGGVDFDKNTIKAGQRVRAVWNEEKKGHMMDIKYFEPIG